MFHGFDGLMTLSQREGVDIRPTLLRVLTDLYVQTDNHSREEERQFAELASRLYDEVDDATRSAVRAKLAVYGGTPRELVWKLALRPSPEARMAQRAEEAAAEHHEAPTIVPDIPKIVETPPAPTLSMKPEDASQLVAMFDAADAAERRKIIQNLDETPLKPSTRVDPRRAARALPTLEQAAMRADADAFISELADALILTRKIAIQIVDDHGGEPLACALKTLGMPSDAFQRVLMFLNPGRGSSVMDVYRLARLYDSISERSALILLSAWRGASLANTRAKYSAGLYDDERQRARPAPAQVRPAAKHGILIAPRNTSRG